ncbi:MAG TPA: protein kinase [Candidatus Paceibacterota bacterium]|nr:protein kinase [Candidatus Paceibacterota bacterium]
MSDRKHETRAVFTATLALTTPEERARYLDQACQDKPELRQRVEALLRAHDQASHFLEADGHQKDHLLEGPGRMIGRYRLLEEIGEGAFGRVYMAEQTEPLRRKVALKIIKAGMDTREVIARFEAERQALALMDHPNIARVLDAGATETGRPYFVMELVRGIPITDYCNQQRLATAARLELFMKVCAAVQHAHQKGIIHRDLKPSNILVTLIDGEPVPKVIDFGVAKALGQKLTEKTLFTAFQQMVGTPAYMSPEQAALSGVDVDGRSDIYSLGVLLYELLTGVTPFDPETLRKAALDEIRQMIRETEPAKPSVRLTELTKRQRTEDRGRRTEGGGQKSADRSQKWKEVQGDLDWIVMKALEKDRGRRYETAHALADDLRHHLRHEPVLAGPPTMRYRLGKFARRRRTELIIAGSVAAVIGIAAALSYWQFVRTREAEGVAASTRAQLDTALSQPPAASRSTDSRARGVFNGLTLVEKAVALSPDERYLAYTDWTQGEGGVTVRRLESGKLRKFVGSGRDALGIFEFTQDLYAQAMKRLSLTNQPAVFEMPFEGYAWSPDARWLAYLWMAPPTHKPDLRIVAPETGEFRLLVPVLSASDFNYYEPQDWSPDGKWLVCARRNEPGLAAVSVPEGQVRLLVSFSSNAVEHARFSPDGQHVVYSRPTGEGEPGKPPPHALYVTAVATGATRPLNLPGNCRTPIWSPNQPVILFTSDRLRTWDLWGVHVKDGKTVSEPFPVQYGFECYSLKLTRAGKLLVHRDVKPGDGYTIVVPRSDSAPLGVESLAGRLYFTMDGRLHAMTVKDAKRTLTPLGYPAPPSRALHRGHRWFLEIRDMPSANTNGPPRELFAVRDDARPDQAIQLTDLPGIGQMTGIHVFSLGALRRGQERNRIINWARDANRGLDDGLISWTASKPVKPGTRPGPSAGSGIYVARVAFDAAGNITGLAEPLSSEPIVTQATTHDWSPDGRHLVYTVPGFLTQSRTNMLKILDVATGQSALLTEGEAPAWSPDGNWIAFHRRNASLHIIKPDGSDLRNLGRMDPPAGMKGWLSPPGPGFYRIVWSPDSKAMVYELWEYGGLGAAYHQLFYRALSGGEPQCLTPDFMTDASPIAWLEGER